LLQIANWCLALASLGIVLAMVDTELTASMHQRPLDAQDFMFTNVVRAAILASTVALVVLVVMYHVTEANVR